MRVLPLVSAAEGVKITTVECVLQQRHKRNIYCLTKYNVKRIYIYKRLVIDQILRKSSPPVFCILTWTESLWRMLVLIMERSWCNGYGSWLILVLFQPISNGQSWRAKYYREKIFYSLCRDFSPGLLYTICTLLEGGCLVGGYIWYADKKIIAKTMKIQN